MSRTLKARLGPQGWQVECAPALAEALQHLARQSGAPAQPEQVMIPYTAALDEVITALVDDLIDLRYEAGRVQLRLFSQEGL